MGYKQLQIKIPTGYTNGQLQHAIARQLKIKHFTFHIENKSLDARKKDNIRWLLRIGVSSPELKGKQIEDEAAIKIEYQKRNKKVLVAGSGPSGFFAAYVLQKSGFETIILERGAEVKKRAQGIQHFENTGIFNPLSNYAFGEGGAGTFSDGKLTSRSKHISKERKFIISKYIQAGAPEEIAYMAHPHVGSDNLKNVVKNLREDYMKTGGQIFFETLLSDIEIRNSVAFEAVTDKGVISADYFIVAPGHSSYETYRMLINKGILFRTKNFAIGSRVEHDQQIINKAQWGVDRLEGVKAAEYRLTSDGDGKHPVYTFCMCPGGKVVPSTGYTNANIVNGMSYYQRDGKFANAACVAGIHPDDLAEKKVTPLEAIEKLKNLEQYFYEYTGGFRSPFCSVKDFINEKLTLSKAKTSYPLGIMVAPLWEMLPSIVVKAIKTGMKDFIQKIKGFDTGIMLGLESKTSSPLQVIRDKTGLCTGFQNLFVIGEGSGYTGGIISSAADGVKVAMNIIDSD